MSLHPDDQLRGIGALAEPARRALYLHVAAQAEPVSREAAAAAVGVAVHSAKFHLDRLVDAGLLEVEHRRLSGRTGPGAGRPAKLYRRTDRELSVSLPPRSYDLAAELLAAAVERAGTDDLPVGEAVRMVAHEEGRRVGRTATGDGSTSDLDGVAATLAPLGFEPRLEEDGLCLANCPFDRLASRHTELVCGLNLSFVGGVLDGLGTSSLTARLAPSPGRCCVAVS